jgi:hypothetical protein
MIMDAPERGALMLVRFVAATLIAWAVVDIALYVAVSQHTHKPVEIFPCILKSITGVVGIVVLIKARALAEWISNKMDE